MVENLTPAGGSTRPTGQGWIALGAFLALMGVGCGAFGAHGLTDFLNAKFGDDPELLARRLDNWKTAADYQMVHAIGMVLVGILLRQNQGRCCLAFSAWAFLGGIVLFSGLLYLLVLTDIRWLGAIVPLGGVSMMVAWGAMGCAALANRSVSGGPSA